jgi:hypothetical protein
MRGRRDRSVSAVSAVGLPDLIPEAHVMGLSFPLGILGATAGARLCQLGGQEGHLRAARGGQRVRRSDCHAEPIALLTVGDEEVLCMEESLSVLVLVLAKGL